MSNWVLYQCLGRCRRKFISAKPSTVRFAIGRPVKCCGEVAQYIRPTTEEESKRHEAGLFKPYVEDERPTETKGPRRYKNPYAHLGVGKSRRKK